MLGDDYCPPMIAAEDYLEVMQVLSSIRRYVWTKPALRISPNRLYRVARGKGQSRDADDFIYCRDDPLKTVTNPQYGLKV